MKWYVVLALILSLNSLAFAQGLNPFMSLRDGSPRFLNDSDFKAARKHLDASQALPVMKAYFESYPFNRFSKKQFFEKLESENFFKDSVKNCQKNGRLNCDKFIKKNTLVLLRAEKMIDDVVFLLLENHLENPIKMVKTKEETKEKLKKHYLSLDLSSLEQKYFFVSLKREEINPQTANLEFSFNPMSDKALKKEFKGKYAHYKKLTPRQRLYLNYSHEQIIKLAEIVKLSSQIMNANRVAVVVDFDGDGTNDMEIEASYSEKYKLGLKILKRELERETVGGILQGKQPTFTDLLAASLEVGYFTPEQLKVMMDFPELRDPKPDTWKKVGKISWLIARAGIMAIPGFGMIAAIPIVIIEAVIEGTKQNGKADTTDSLF